jgi:putative transposase
MCDVLEVTRSGFYAWKKRPVSQRTTRRRALASAIRSIHSEQYLDVYGSPRMHQELLQRGFEVCENTVAAVMKQEGIAASTEKKFRVTTTDSNHSEPVAENILDRDFTVQREMKCACGFVCECWIIR